jgi:hypothetical protein
MNSTKPVLFHDALKIAVAVARDKAREFTNQLVLVRDLRGKIKVLLDGRREDYSNFEQSLTDFCRQISAALGAYGFPPESALLFQNELALDVSVLERRVVHLDDALKIELLDRQIVAQDWLRGPLERRTRNPRFTFFGIKGGVGRSTALALWGWRLAKRGRKVLAVDLDLESPGMSATLLPAEAQPDYGIVDWFVEDAVGQAHQVEAAMVSSSPLSRDLPGELRVAPAYGSKTGEYLPKLARCYAELSGTGVMPWAQRVHQLVESLEIRESPDLVLLDSRAGLHDIAAVLVTRLGAEAFLFAVDSAQTWNAYSFLFRHWKDHPQLREFRTRLQVVATLVPETERERHLEAFLEHSWDLFRETLYDEASADVEAYSFDLHDEAAPHYPLIIFWHRALQDFDPAGSQFRLDERIAEEAAGHFMDEADRLLEGAGAEDRG